MKNKYFQSYKQENKGVINIFGDIVDDAFFENEVSSVSFAQELSQLGDVDSIDVYINSYGGSVAQGFAIYNQLPAYVRYLRHRYSGTGHRGQTHHLGI